MFNRVDQNQIHDELFAIRGKVVDEVLEVAPSRTSWRTSGDIPYKDMQEISLYAIKVFKKKLEDYKHPELASAFFPKLREFFYSQAFEDQIVKKLRSSPSIPPHALKV
jgi:hypothetical protein